MIPALEDFTSKYGFRDGAAFEFRDLQARDLLVKLFNEECDDQRAVAWDRPGMHNGCMIVFFKRQSGWKPKQYLDAWHRNEVEPLDPNKVYQPGGDLNEFIGHIYENLLDEE